MNPIDFRGANLRLGQPEGYDEALHGPCATLPVHVANGIVTSCWKPTWQERLKVFFGKPVYLLVLSGSETQPPVALTVP